MGSQPAAEFEMIDDLLTSLGGVSPKRVRLTPTPGTATVRDVIRLLDIHKRKFELVDGTLVEKVMGAKESFIAIRVAVRLSQWNDAAGNVGMPLVSSAMARAMGAAFR